MPGVFFSSPKHLLPLLLVYLFGCQNNRDFLFILCSGCEPLNCLIDWTWAIFPHQTYGRSMGTLDTISHSETFPASRLLRFLVAILPAN